MIASDLASIERLLNDFSWHAARGDGAALAQLFVADGVLFVGGRELTRRAAIADDCDTRGREAGRKTRHVWSNLHVERSDATSASVTAVQLTFEQRAGVGSTQLRISDLFDDVRKDGDGVWSFVRRTIQRELTLNI